MLGCHIMLRPTFPIYHPNSWKSYHFPTAKGTVSPMQPSDGMILVIGPRLEGHSVIFLAIQTHLSCRFLLAVDSLGLRRSGSSSQIINQAQDFPEQASWDCNLGQLKCDVPAMADNFRTDLDQLLPQRRQRPLLHGIGQRQGTHEVAEVIGGLARPSRQKSVAPRVGAWIETRQTRIRRSTWRPSLSAAIHWLIH